MHARAAAADKGSYLAKAQVVIPVHPELLHASSTGPEVAACCGIAERRERALITMTIAAQVMLPPEGLEAPAAASGQPQAPAQEEQPAPSGALAAAMRAAAAITTPSVAEVRCHPSSGRSLMAYLAQKCLLLARQKPRLQ